MMRILVAAFGCVATLAATPAAAEEAGRGIGYAVTGPVFDLPAGISVARQDVHVSLHSVRLTYVFKTSRRESVHFGFAMPGMPVDASPDAIGVTKDHEAAGLAADTQPVNYLNLSVRVNGRPPRDGKDVTRQLRDAGVPLLYNLNGEAPWKRLSPEVEAMLEANGLLELDAALWSYQASFTWDQSFEPGETRVEVSYVPVANYWSDITRDRFPEIEPGGAATKTYCIDDALRRVFSRKHGYDLYTVTHKTPSSGSPGPVGRYRLTVDRGTAANLVAFCPLAVMTISPTGFEWTATNYTLGGATGVLFFVAPEPAMSGQRK